jgi:alanine racemase
MILLDDLLAAGGQLHGSAVARRFSDFSYDSRMTNPGELFLALRTTRADGHDYIPAAFAAGATGVICTWPPYNTDGVTVVVSENPETLVQTWASNRLKQVDPTLIAVTGSVGKTSTKRAIDTLLSTIAPTFSTRQSFNSLLGLPVALARLQKKHQFAVLEFGSDSFGEIAHLASLFPPHIGVVTNVDHAYIKAFGSLDGIAREKKALIEALPAEGWAVLNGDDPYVAAMQQHTAAQVVTFGCGSDVHLRASDIHVSLFETSFRVHWNGHAAIHHHPSSFLVTIPLLGEPAVFIGLAAIAVAIISGMELAEAASHLSLVRPVEGRLHALPAASGATVLDDTFNATLPSMQAALRTLSAVPARRRIVVMGALSDPGAEAQATYHEIGTLAGSVADMLICKGDFGNMVVQAARKEQPGLKTSVVHTATGALQSLPLDLRAEDIILIAGSAEARMERVAAGLLDPGAELTTMLVRQGAGWHTVRVGIPDRPTWVRIDLDAVAYNTRRLHEIAGVPVMAVIKADAYGHGAVRVARAVLSSEVTMLAVATLSEARTLREADITAPILVLGYTPPWQAREAVLLDVTCAVFDLDVARALSDAAVALQRDVMVHMKVDTGMGRLGMQPDEVGIFLYEVSKLPRLRVAGLYSHFATADSADETYARQQLERFQQVLYDITAAGLRPPVVHMANSAALLRFPEARFDMVRPGIACYGLAPSYATPVPADFRPVLSFHTEVAQVKSLSRGTALSYGRTFVTQRSSLIATIPVGYADGFRRSPPWREVLVRGKRAPVVGRVCMDYALIDVTDIEGVKRGDMVTLIGAQGTDQITADEVADWLQTINYEVVAAILPRVPREVDM